MILNFFLCKLWKHILFNKFLKKLKIHFKSSPIVVRYGETDQMGVVHHSNYLRFFEVARLQWLKKMGISYNDMEHEGVMMPVIAASIDYKAPAKFEDELTIEIHLQAVPLVKMIFDYQVFNQERHLICTASTTLAFMRTTDRRPIRCPEKFKALFASEI